jgi:hypothetical protein
MSNYGESHLYNIADIRFRIETPFAYEESAAFLPFVCADAPAAAAGESETAVRFRFHAVECRRTPPIASEGELRIYEEGDTVYREFHCGDQPPHACTVYRRGQQGCECRLYPGGERYAVSTQNIFQLIGFEWLLCAQDALILHAACIRCNGRGILFTASSGTGKSTQADLWVTHHGAELLNGDRGILRRREGVWRAYGSPYAGSSQVHKQDSVPIRAIVRLYQAPENRVKRLTGLEAFCAIYPHMTVNSWDAWFVDRSITMTEDIINRVPVYELHCRPDREATEVLAALLDSEDAANGQKGGA